MDPVSDTTTLHNTENDSVAEEKVNMNTCDDSADLDLSNNLCNKVPKDIDDSQSREMLLVDLVIDSQRDEFVSQGDESVKHNGQNTSDIELCTGGISEHVSEPQHENLDIDHSLTLTDLPMEILLHIASFLKPQVIVCSLCQVCKTFYHIFSHDHYWKTRISVRWPKKYPVLDRDDFNWPRACMEREEIHSQWSDVNQNFHHFMFRDGFFAAVDVVHLFQNANMLAIGSRDRHLNIVDLRKYDCDKPNPCKDITIYDDQKTHKGWVWSMASCENVLATGSWDTKVRLWNVGESSVQFLSEIKCKSALLGLHFEPNFIAAGGFDKRLYMVDPRAQDEITIKRYHTQPILSIAADDKYIITGSEDKVVSIYDRAAGKNYKKIETDSFGMDLSYGNGQLWIGNKDGKLLLIDARDGLFDETNIQTVDVGHTGRLTGVVHTDGGIFTCSTDNSVKVADPVLEPSVIANLTCHTAAVARISYKNGVLASAGSDVAVGVWMPKKVVETVY